MTQLVLSSSIQSYLIHVQRFPLLTAGEEFELAVRFRGQNDLDAAHKLITSNLRFVVKIAMEYRNYGFRLPDLVQEGNIGLMKAVKKFDPAQRLSSDYICGVVDKVSYPGVYFEKLEPCQEGNCCPEEETLLPAQQE